MEAVRFSWNTSIRDLYYFKLLLLLLILSLKYFRWTQGAKRIQILKECLCSTAVQFRVVSALWLTLGFQGWKGFHGLPGTAMVHSSHLKHSLTAEGAPKPAMFMAATWNWYTMFSFKSLIYNIDNITDCECFSFVFPGCSIFFLHPLLHTPRVTLLYSSCLNILLADLLCWLFPEGNFHESFYSLFYNHL